VSYFFHSTGRIYPLVMPKGGERLEVQCAHSFATNDMMATLEAGAQGLGIVRTTTMVAQRHLKSGALLPVLTDWSTETVPFYVVYPSHRHLNARLRVFIDWVAELYAPFATRFPQPAEQAGLGSGGNDTAETTGIAVQPGSGHHRGERS